MAIIRAQAKGKLVGHLKKYIFLAEICSLALKNTIQKKEKILQTSRAFQSKVPPLQTVPDMSKTWSAVRAGSNQTEEPTGGCHLEKWPKREETFE